MTESALRVNNCPKIMKFITVSSGMLLMAARQATSFGIIPRPHGVAYIHPTTTVSSSIRPSFSLNMSQSSDSSSTSTTFPKAHDGEALQHLFHKQCDEDGLMTKSMLMTVPAIQELLDNGDLMMEELNDIWDAAPKFPDVSINDIKEQRIDVDSFIQIYRDVDDLFEEDLEEEEEETEVIEEAIQEAQKEEEEEELEQTFAQLCDQDGLVSKTSLLEWEEMQKLFSDGLLGEEEFEEIWVKTAKSPGSSDQLDVEGFLSFNVALDDLFDFDDEKDEDDSEEEEVIVIEEPPTKSKQAKPPKAMVEGDDLPPGVLFAALANDDYLVGMKELKRWSELQEMLDDESLLPLELQSIYDDTPKANGDMLDEAGFTALYEAIDSLFEDDEEEETKASQPPANEAKSQLLAVLEEINSDTERLPCGLESTEREEKVVVDVVNELEKSPSNVLTQKQGKIQLTDLAGSWELLYSSSSAMKFNKGLSGLGGSVPNGRFAGLIQNLQASKYMTDVEYIERIEVNPSSASFDVRVSGDWDLSQSVSLFTGAPSTVMTVEPARVMYGPTSTRADHWKSLGPMNMLDVTYLDDDLRVMRGNTATDAIFVFRRVYSS